MKLNFDNTYAALGENFSTRLDPLPFENPKLLHFNDEAAKLLDWPQEEISDETLAELCSGKKQFEGGCPIATVYAGHQFGGYSPQLGDGRGLILGEVRNSKDEKWDLFLKGSGKTPYSRFGDGRAVLRSSIREYLGSEALYYLGIRTSRALSIVGSDHPVAREEMETGAMVIRLAQSHIRFGHFEFFHYSRSPEQLKTLMDYSIDQNYPEAWQEENPYKYFLASIVDRTAEMIAKWQSVGFCHGVMNTDNFNILGDTFDYGPFGFMDEFDPTYICNHSDHNGRYSYQNQPGIGLWNLNALGNTFGAFIETEEITEVLEFYKILINKYYFEHMLKKLGISEHSDESTDFVIKTTRLMKENHCDFTIFFRALCYYSPSDESSKLAGEMIDLESFSTWKEEYDQWLAKEADSDEERQRKLKAINPKYIARNYLLQDAITKAEQGDHSEVDKLLTILRKPFDEQPEFESYAQRSPDWAKGLEISCSS